MESKQTGTLPALSLRGLRGCLCVSVAYVTSTLVASGKLRLTLRGPRFRGRYLRQGATVLGIGKDGTWEM